MTKKSKQEVDTTDQLKKEWGKDYEGKLKHAQRAFNRFAKPEFAEFMDETGLGNDSEYLRLFSKIGEMIGEESYPQYKKYFEHLEYLGAKTTEHKDSDGYSSFEVNHPILNFWIFPTSNGLYHRILIHTKKSLKQQDKITIIEFVNKSNYDTTISNVLFHKNVVIIGAFYSGGYSKLSYGKFVETFLRDCESALDGCSKKINKLIYW